MPSGDCGDSRSVVVSSGILPEFTQPCGEALQQPIRRAALSYVHREVEHARLDGLICVVARSLLWAVRFRVNHIGHISIRKPPPRLAIGSRTAACWSGLGETCGAEDFLA